MCSAHFNKEHFINNKSKVKRLKPDALPSLEQKVTRKRSLPSKLEEINRREALQKDDDTQTASEGEGHFELTGSENMVSRSSFVNIPQPCDHRLSFEQLCEMCDTIQKEEKCLQW